ncbi:hypothetical protein HFP89_01475 [Wenzhouxiangella sp. XN79A]|uniref:hypothetical protein n=1 Tax=Wenzhouxiangella sp. XN79A TaxID=2724193 RepID=UPI00144A9570|nr:hypothetical protein [Wenzhouxiangella sp. XN79A]NKI33833.1 hypothetical protein [Wenzhouxiangella sp. XN79A]
MVERSNTDIDEKELDRIERLRDRTDEIELIISGLTTVALFTLPGWLFDAVSARYSHQSYASSQAMEILLILAPGVFYALGGCFAVHLMIRAYWAGLVGLRSVYPGGIVWERVPGIGRQTREHHQAQLPDLRRAITSADHAASGLFSVISMIALGMLWISVLMIAILMGSQLLGAVIGDSDRAIDLSLWLLVGLFIGAPGLLWLFDAVLGARFPGLAERAWFRGMVRRLIVINGWIWPQRLILPVQLTLQTNTRPYLFSLMIALGSFGILFLGFVRYEAWTQFSISDPFRYLDRSTIEGGIDSAHYESLRGRPDRLRMVPTLDDFEQRSAFLRVFLPYYPQRDNPVLDARCPEAASPVDCLRGLWTVRLGRRTIAPDTLLPTERRDLNQRGLTGLVPLTDLPPGLHVLEIVWNEADASGGSAAARTYRVPFVFSPDQELGARQIESADSAAGF